MIPVALLWALAAQVKPQDPSVVAKGSAIFAAKCGIGYCHGKEGAAGRGPRLAGHKFETEYLEKVIRDGAGNSQMPAFKDQLSGPEIGAVVAYILSLSEDRSSTPAPEVGLEPAGPAAPDPAVEAGRALFFDSANPRRCSQCHQYQGQGADVGPDLTAVASRPAEDILRDILEPDARLAVQPVAVVTRSGERIGGVKQRQTGEFLRIYDTGSLPPVLRTVYKDQIVSVTPEARSPMPSDYGKTLDSEQLQNLVKFLKSAAAR
jgi:putative heme-binding domain-containing protein